MLVVSLFAELLSQRQAAGRALRRPAVLPDRPQPSRDALRRRLPDARPTGTTRSSASSSPRPATGRSSRPIRYAAKHAQLLRASRPNPAPPDAENWLGTDDRGRDMLARLLYGFRVSVLFALALTVDRRRCSASLTGAVQGYFGGRSTSAFAALHRDLELDARALPADHLRVDLRAQSSAAAAGPAVACSAGSACRTTCAPSSCATATLEFVQGGARAGPVEPADHLAPRAAQLA